MYLYKDKRNIKKCEFNCIRKRFDLYVKKMPQSDGKVINRQQSKLAISA